MYILTDSHSYSETISLVEELGPHEVLLHDGCKGSVLSMKVVETVDRMSADSQSDNCRVMYISRQYFDQDKGADMLTCILSGKVDADLVAKYTVLAGSYCLLRYVENCDGINFAPHSVRLVYGNDRRGKLSIDRRSSINLELIANAKTDRHKQSLYGTINCTKTVVGARLLKASILRPCTDIATIDTRLDTVELLLRSNQACSAIASVLKLLPDLDKMLTGLTSVHKQV